MPSLLKRVSSKGNLKDDESVTSVASGSSKSSIRRRISKKFTSSKIQKAADAAAAAAAETTKTPTKAAAEPVKNETPVDAAASNASKEVKESPEESTEPKIEQPTKNEEVDQTTEDEIPPIQSAPSVDSIAEDSAVSLPASTSILSLVLLLMDTTTRRFELVQLEFDARHAIGSDVMSQIPHSAGDEITKNMKYDGVCTKDGEEMALTSLISDFCATNEVILAVPEGYDGKKTAEQAAPILADPSVVVMLRETGVSLPEVEDTDVKTTTEAVGESAGATEPATTEERAEAVEPTTTEVSADATKTAATEESTDATEPSATEESAGATTPTDTEESTDTKEQETASESSPGEKNEKSDTVEKSAIPSMKESLPCLNDFVDSLKPKLEEVKSNVKSLTEQIKSSPSKSNIVLVGFILVAVCILAWVLLAGGSTAEPSLVESIPEPAEMDLPEDIAEEPKKKLFQAFKKFRKAKVDVDVES